MILFLRDFDAICEEGNEGVLESDVMEEDVMYRNVKLLLLESFEYVPLVKGTSDENERANVLERVMEVVSLNESSPVMNDVNLGRSH